MYRAPELDLRHLVVTAVSGFVVARDRRTGARVWQQTFHSEQKWATRLCVHDGRVVVYGHGAMVGGEGFLEVRANTSVLACFDYGTGSHLWSHRVKEEVYAPTLLVDEDQIFVADGNTLACFSLHDGRPLWRDVVEGAVGVQSHLRVPVAVALPDVAAQADQR